MGTRKATLIRNSGPGSDGRFLAFVMRFLLKGSDREPLNSNKSCLRIAREFIPRPDVAAENHDRTNRSSRARWASIFGSRRRGASRLRRGSGWFRSADRSGSRRPKGPVQVVLSDLAAKLK